MNSINGGRRSHYDILDVIVMKSYHMNDTNEDALDLMVVIDSFTG